MEQKQLDEMDESFFGEEFIEDEPLVLEEEKEENKLEDELEVESEPKPKKAKKTAKKTSKKSTKKSEKKAQTENDALEIEQSEINTEGTEETEKKEDDFIEIKPADEEPVKEESTPVDPWAEGEENDSGLFKEASTWKAITGIAVILLIFSIFTQGFNFSNGFTPTGAVVGSTLSLSDAEEKVLNYVNGNLLQPPFLAEVESSKELDSLYMVVLSVAGQSVDSYITKDGELFFPQGFKVDEKLDVGAKEVGETAEEVLLDVNTNGDPVLGDENAPVTIVEFSDFECPFCKRGYETMKLVEENYVDTGKVKLVFKDFPLNFHPEAEPAAMAAECAHEQDKFWEFHDLLYENQAELSTENYKKWAGELGLDTDKFNDCLDSEKYLDEVRADLTDGKEYGVAGTPAFFVNGKLISGAQPYSVFEQEIEALLADVDELSLVEEEELEESTVIEIEVPEEDLEEVVEEEPVGDLVMVPLNAKKWVFTPDEIKVKKGDVVQFTIVPVGLEFTFAVPELGVEQEVSGTTMVQFTADETGEFEFKCGSCEDWRGMTGTLVVE